MNRVTELLLLAGLLALAYLSWLHQQNLLLIEDDLEVLRRQVGDLTAARAAAVKTSARPRKPPTNGASK